MAGKILKKLKDHTTLDTELRIWHPFHFGEIRNKKRCMNPMQVDNSSIQIELLRNNPI